VLTRGYVGSQSVSSSGVTRISGEEPSGVIDGANTAFLTTQIYAVGTETLYLNGVRQRFGASNDYTRAESTPSAGFDQVLFTLAPRSGDVVLIDYDGV